MAHYIVNIGFIMTRFLVWLLRIVLGLIILSGIIACLGYIFLSRSLPDYDKELTVSHIQNEIEIVRNTNNVPHIFGQSDPDTMFALGYAHAQDRLWQMTLFRRTAQGRLSEVFGRDTLEIDTLLRQLDIYSLARSSVKAMRPDTQILLQSYSDGVNARLLEINENALGRGAPEFFLFSKNIAPWHPTDSVAILKLFGLQLSTNLEQEVLRTRLSFVLNDDALHDILPETQTTGPIPHYTTVFPEVSAFEYTAEASLKNLLNPFKPRQFSETSNVWSALESRSARRGTLLANDPQMMLTAPSIWYLARLELETGGIIGGTIPGVPVVILGRSNDLGWGVSASYADDQDVYIEKINPKNPNEYLTPNGFIPFITKQTIIQIKDESPVTVNLKWTQNGPILPKSHYNIQSVTPLGHVASLSWTMLDPKDTSLETSIDMMRAKSVKEALEISKRFIAPSQNVILIDKSHIAMRMIGALPKRHPRHQFQGQMPSPGWIKDNRWQGVFPDEVNPLFLDPNDGILGNTNNKPISRPFPQHVSHAWGDTQRIQRLNRLMQNRRVHTRESFIEAQLDTVSPTARTLLPLIWANLWFESETIEPDSHAAQRQKALDLLAKWNGDMNEHSPEPLIYSAWMNALQKRIIEDDLGELSNAFTKLEPIFIERVFRDINGASRWCDVQASQPVETCSQIAQLSLDDALSWLKDKYGGDVENMRWGDAHEATHDHPALGDVPVLKWFTNIRQSTSGGDNTLQRGLTLGTGEDPFLNVHAAAYRGVYDFADPDSSVFVISTGQSGHPLSRFYDDMAQLWRRGEYIPMSLDPALARAGRLGITRLIPAPAQ